MAQEGIMLEKAKAEQKPIPEAEMQQTLGLIQRLRLSRRCSSVERAWIFWGFLRLPGKSGPLSTTG